MYSDKENEKQQQTTYPLIKFNWWEENGTVHLPWSGNLAHLTATRKTNYFFNKSENEPIIMEK